MRHHTISEFNPLRTAKTHAVADLNIPHAAYSAKMEYITFNL